MKILITGANRGLGSSIRDYLLNMGHFVYGTTRDLNGVNDGERLKFLHLDLMEKKSIDSLVNYFIQNDICLDAIIHNAGIAYLDPADVLDEEEHRHLFDVNFFGPVILTKKMIPLMRNSKKGKLIFISSVVSDDHWPYLGSYAASKAALEAIAFEWAVLLKKWNIHVSVIQPNPLPTNMQILRSKHAQNSPYPELIQDDLKWESIEDTCKLISQILCDPSPKFKYQTGIYSHEAVHKFLHKEAYEMAVAEHHKKMIETS